MRKIAFRGLLGQKRSTLLLWSVVTLAFLFLVLSTTIITSLRKTDSDQRIATYGRWQVMVETETTAQAEEYAALASEAVVLPLIRVYGLDYFSGDNTYYLTTGDPELAELGQFTLKEGRWPEAEDEIVLEYARLSALGLAVGDSFRVVSEVSLPLREDAELDHELLLKRAQQKAIAEANVPLLLAFRDGSWIDMVSTKNNRIRKANEMFFSWWEGGQFRSYTHLFADDEHPDGQELRIADMTEEQLLLALDAFWELYVYNLDVGSYLSAEEQRYNTGITDLIGCEERNMRVRIENGQMLLIIPSTYTVCGVIDTYSDRWDSGLASRLPSGFVTQANYDDLLRCQQAALEAYPDFYPVEYPSLVLACGEDADATRTLWADAAAVYNAQHAVPEELFRFFFREDRTDPQSPLVQYCVQFQLADMGAGTTSPVSGWLVPDEALLRSAKEYHTDSLLPAVGEERVIVQQEISFDELDGKEFVAGAVVRFEAGGEQYELPFAEFCAGAFKVEGRIPVSGQYLWHGDWDKQTDSSALRLNSFAYPSSAEGSSRMLVLVTVILFVTTVSAVFQIFFTQMRKRLRRIVLMKSIGAQDSQIARMLVWEFVYFLCGSLVPGVLLGLGGAKLATALLSQARGQQVTLFLSPVVFAAALAAGALALAIGMAVPSIMAVGVPLTGRTVRKKPLPPPRKEVRQDFLHVTLRGLTANRSRTLGSAALCVFMMLIGTLCLFLGVRFLTPWREAVQRDGKPEYLLRAPYSMSDRQQEAYLAELEALGVCGSIDVSRVSTSALLSREDTDGSLLLETADMTGVVDDIEGYYITLQGIDPAGGLYESYREAATVGTLNDEAFASGEEVLLLVPLYRQTSFADRTALEFATGWDRLDAAGIRTSYYAEYDGHYDRETAVQVGDTIRLAAKTRMYSASGMSPGFTYNTQNRSVRVGAVLYYFPEEGIWPVSGSGEGYHLVCSSHLIAQLLPNAIRTRSETEIRAIKVGGLIDACGSTDFYINGAEDFTREELDTALLIFARSHYMDIEFYHESNEKLLQDAINNILLTCLLGLTAVLLALVIFANTVASDIEAERGRIGILQALGVSNRLLLCRQLCIGLSVSGIALVLANALLWGGVALFAAISGNVLGNLLWHYPFRLHAALCALVALVITLLYLLPMAGLRRYLPIENIKSRK